MAARIRKGDKVRVMTGSDKGKSGKVLRVIPADDRAVVEGVNMAKRHQKARGMGQQGGIVEREATIHLSNLRLVDPATDQAVKVGFRVMDDGKKVRVAKATGNLLEG